MRHPLLLLLALAPKNALSRLAGRTAGLPLPRFLRRPFLRAFGRTFGVDFGEIRDPLESFPTLQHFFIRALKEGARPVDPAPGLVVSPCDGAWGAAGRVEAGQILQVKGRPYSLAELLGDPAEAARCEGGFFATLYLSPKDYHRFHLPCAARLDKATYLPGALWPVNSAGVGGIPGLFAVNERIVGFFEIAEPGFAGRLAIAAVGATMVGKVKLVTEDLETNRGEKRADREYRPPRDFARGEEWGRFEFGSTLVLVASPGALELEVAPPGTAVRLGRRIGRLGGSPEPMTEQATEPPAAPAAPAGPARNRLAVAGLLLAHFLLALGGILVHCLTYDERTHLPAGMAAAATGEIRLNRQHPPLIKLLAGLAANTAEPRLPLAGEAYRQGREWEFGHQVLFATGNDPAALLRRGRLPTLLISLLGGFFVYRFSRELFGAGGGVFSLALWAFSPTVLGHDGWVTMDAPVAALATGSLYGAFRLAAALRAGRDGRAPALATGVLLGLSLAVKFSGLVFVAALAPLLAWAAWRHWRERPGTLPRTLLAAAGVALAAAAAMLWAVYLFPRDPLFYLHDVARLYQDLKPDYLFYLHGEFARRFPHYFLATFALKSTPVELLLLPLAAFAVWVSPRRGELLAFVLWPALFFFVVTSAFATNQGHRYILPCYPLLFVAAGELLPRLAATAAAGRPAARLPGLGPGQRSLVAPARPPGVFQRLRRRTAARSLLARRLERRLGPGSGPARGAGSRLAASGTCGAPSWAGSTPASTASTGSRSRSRICATGRGPAPT